MENSLFDLSGLELVKKKYYNAAKVTQLLDLARAEHEKLLKENEELRAQLESISSQKTQISDTLMSAQSIARQIIEDAKTQADDTTKLAQSQAEEVLKAAEKKAELILSGAKSRKEASAEDMNEAQEYALRCVENCVDKLRQQHIEAIEFLNAQWQDFLSGLILPSDGVYEVPEAEELPPTEAVDWMALASMELPEIEDPYADIDAETFFSAGFYSEQTGADIFQQLKSMMDSIDDKNEE